MRAVQITEFGGPEVLRVADLPEPEPRDGHTVIDVDAAGLNYADTHQAEDSYLAPQRLPLVPGGEVVGIARDGRHAGRRVLALLADYGGYAEVAIAPEATTYPIDDGLGDVEALALLVQGTTAWHLLRTCSHLQPGESVVVHSAAGGVGHLAVQLAKQWGAGRVIGTASGPEKAGIAAKCGADAVVDLSGTADASEVKALLREANGGRPVDVVLEMTGGHVFDGSLAALAPLGRLVAFGMASRTPPQPVQAPSLMRSSRTVSGFWLVHALREPGLAPVLEELASMIRAGRLAPIVGGTYALEDAASAHEALRSRRTVGKLVLRTRSSPVDEAAG